MTREQASELNENMLFADGFDDALVGVVHQFGREPVACYDYGKCLTVLIRRDGMTAEEAIEYMDFNVLGAYMGEHTPVFLQIGE